MKKKRIDVLKKEQMVDVYVRVLSLFGHDMVKKRKKHHWQCAECGIDAMVWVSSEDGLPCAVGVKRCGGTAMPDEADVRALIQAAQRCLYPVLGEPPVLDDMRLPPWLRHMDNASVV